MEEVYSKKDYIENNDTLLIINKKYKIYSSINNKKFKNNIGYVILCEDGTFHGLDSDMFYTKNQKTILDFNI